MRVLLLAILVDIGFCSYSGLGLTTRRLRRIIPRQEVPSMVRPLLLAPLAVGLAAAAPH
jgi:hypothetical protein